MIHIINLQVGGETERERGGERGGVNKKPTFLASLQIIWAAVYNRLKLYGEQNGAFRMIFDAILVQTLVPRYK